MRQVHERPRQRPSRTQAAAVDSRRPLAIRVLTSNVTIAVVAIGLLTAGVFMFKPGGTKPPKAGDMSVEQLTALLNNTHVDRATADGVAAAKERAYEQEQAREKAEAARQKALEAKAKKDAKLRAELAAKAEASRKAQALKNAATNPAGNKALGQQMNALKGWAKCWPSLLTMWNHESGWRQNADNPGSSAYGIPQALPGSKMASAGSDWRTSSATQIAWGLGYIQARYNDPCGAWNWWQAHHWY